MNEWWYGVGFIVAVVLGLAFHLLPYVEQLVIWRKKRGLAGYDPKQFGDVESRSDTEQGGTTAMRNPRESGDPVILA